MTKDLPIFIIIQNFFKYFNMFIVADYLKKNEKRLSNFCHIGLKKNFDYIRRTKAKSKSLEKDLNDLLGLSIDDKELRPKNLCQKKIVAHKEQKELMLSKKFPSTSLKNKPKLNKSSITKNMPLLNQKSKKRISPIKIKNLPLSSFVINSPRHTCKESNKSSRSLLNSSLSSLSLNSALCYSTREKEKFKKLMKKGLSKKVMRALSKSRNLSNEQETTFEKLKSDLKEEQENYKNIQTYEKVKRKKFEQVKNTNGYCSFIQKGYADLINFCDSYYKMGDISFYERRRGIIEKYPELREKAHVADKKPKEKPRKNNLRLNSNKINHLVTTLNKDYFDIVKQINELN